MTLTPFARALVRKSERELKTARLALSGGDSDNAVNRSFYLTRHVESGIDIDVTFGGLSFEQRGLES